MRPVFERGLVHASGRRRWWWLVAIGAGLLLGPLDLWGQVNTPYPWANLFNSAAVWAAAAFAYGRWARELPVAAVGGVIMLAIGVEAYYLTDVLVRDANSSNLTSPTAFVWLIGGVAAGVVFGVGGTWAAGTAGWRAVVGRAALPSIFGAEAVDKLLRRDDESGAGVPDDLGQFALLLALLGIASLVATTRGIERRAAIQVAAVTAVATAVVGIVVRAII
jgi:hypothetical protein